MKLSGSVRIRNLSRLIVQKILERETRIKDKFSGKQVQRNIKLLSGGYLCDLRIVKKVLFTFMLLDV